MNIAIISLATSAVVDMWSLHQQSPTVANLTMSSDNASKQWVNANIPWTDTAVPNTNDQIPQWSQKAWIPSNTAANLEIYTQDGLRQSNAGHFQSYNTFPTATSSINQMQIPQMQNYQHATPNALTRQFLQPLCYSSPATSRFHQARISLVPTPTGGLMAIVKRKRKRTMFTTEQIEVLESVFSKKPYVTREDRQVLVNQLQINDTSIKVWFQNRRLKGKRETEQAVEEDYEENTLTEESFYSDANSASSKESADSFSTSERLDRIESELKQKADDSGYVTLDDSVMTEIVNVIDTVLSPDVDLDALSNSNETEDVSESEGSVYAGSIYEPISPAASEIADDEASRWEPSAPEQSLQRLFDLHFC